MKSKRKASLNANLLSPNGDAAAAEDQGQSGGGMAPARVDGADEIAANREGDEGKEEKSEEVVVEDGVGGREGEAEAEEENDDGEEEEEEEAGEEEAAAEEEDQDEGQDERAKLDEGFYEIEAIRRKRVRKGQLQYLIKWRGWPETANTWEPLENLQSCSDIIEAFEERMQSGKSTRKRKRKSWGSHSQGKKKQSHASSANNLTGDEVSAADRSLPSTSLNTSSLASLRAHTHEEDNNDENGTNSQVAIQAGDNGCTSRPIHLLDVKDDTEYDPKLSELRGTGPSNDANGDKFAVQLIDVKALEVVENGSSLKVDSVDPVQTNRRTGAKRRKPASVKRFKKDLASCEAPPVDNTVCNISLSCEGEMTEGFPIIKILKPVSYSASSLDNIQDVSVTFAAMRSDGKEVLVDNKFLKANDPLLLINYYEKHLKYST